MSAKNRRIRNGIALSAAITVIALGAPAFAADAPLPVTGITKVTEGLTGPTTPANIRDVQGTVSTVTMAQKGVTQQFNTQKLDVKNLDGQFKAYQLRPQTKAGNLPKGNNIGVKELPLNAVGLNDQNGAQLDSLLEQSKATDLAKSPVGTLLKSSNLNPGVVTESQRTAATQAAIWNVTSGAQLLPEHNDPVVTALYNALLTSSKVGAVTERKSSPLSQVPGGALPSADQLPAPLQSAAGQIAGPFQMAPKGLPMDLNVAGTRGAQLVNPSGLPITKAAPGEKFYLKFANVPSGDAVINTVSEPKAVAGRIFAPVKGLKNNAMIAESGSMLPQTTPYNVGLKRGAANVATAHSTTPVASTTDCSGDNCKDLKAATDKPEKLAVTGSALTGFIAAGVVLLGGGAMLFWFSRRRARLAETK